MRCDAVFALAITAILVPLVAGSEEQRVDLPSLIGPLTPQDWDREFDFDAGRSLEGFETLVLHLEGAARPGVLEGAGPAGERTNSGVEVSVSVVEPVATGPAVTARRRFGVDRSAGPLEGPFSVDLTVRLSGDLPQRATGRGSLRLHLHPPVRAPVCDSGCRFIEPPTLQITRAYLVLREGPENQPSAMIRANPGEMRGDVAARRPPDGERPTRAAAPIAGSKRHDPVSIAAIPAREPIAVNSRVTLPTGQPKLTSAQITMPEVDEPEDDDAYRRLCIPPAQSRDPVLSDETRERARDLLAKIGIELSDTLVLALVSDSRFEREDGSVFDGTFIYCDQRYAGLPIRGERVLFAFSNTDSGAVPRDNLNRRAMEGLIGEADLGVDPLPEIERAEAIGIYRNIGAKSTDPIRLRLPSDDACEPRAELMVWNEKGGRPEPPHYLLVWVVMPGNGYSPQAIIDANTGEVRSFDDGVRD